MLLVGIALLVSVGCFTWAAAGGPTRPEGPVDGDRSTARTVYVSCRGDDRNAGTSAAPLRTPAAVLGRPLGAGTTVALERGCVWPAPLELRGDGTASRPIVLESYGTGPDPIVTGAAVPGTAGLIRLLGAYQTIRDLHVTAGRGAGVEIRGPHGAVRDVVVDRAGIGVLFAARSGSASGVQVRDLRMVVDTAGGDDDYGAVGFNVQAADVEIARSSCSNCRATSHDYGFDGGFAEIWNYGDSLDIHDNVGRNTDGILEIGGDQPDASARGVVVRDNTFDSAHGGFIIHDADRFGMAVPSLTVSGNTIVNTSGGDGPILSGQIRDLRFDGNQVSTAGLVSASGAPASHRCNVYDLTGAGRVGFALGETERLHGGATPSCDG